VTTPVNLSADAYGPVEKLAFQNTADLLRSKFQDETSAKAGFSNGRRKHDGEN
jgi:hypothetical protein